MAKSSNNNTKFSPFHYEKPKKGYRAQKPIYKSVSDFMQIVANHPELDRDANFPSDESQIDLIPEDKIEEVEMISQFFSARQSGAQAPQSGGSPEQPTSELGEEQRDEPTEQGGATA